MENNKTQMIDYKTHILIAVRDDGAMSVVCDWPSLPTLAEVHEQIGVERNRYAAFALCTPTSILPVDADASNRPLLGRST